MTDTGNEIEILIECKKTKRGEYIAHPFESRKLEQLGLLVSVPHVFEKHMTAWLVTPRGEDAIKKSKLR